MRLHTAAFAEHLVHPVGMSSRMAAIAAVAFSQCHSADAKYELSTIRAAPSRSDVASASTLGYDGVRSGELVLIVLSVIMSYLVVGLISFALGRRCCHQRAVIPDVELEAEECPAMDITLPDDENGNLQPQGASTPLAAGLPLTTGLRTTSKNWLDLLCAMGRLVLTQGKHNGRSFDYVLQADPGYIQWLEQRPGVSSNSHLWMLVAYANFRVNAFKQGILQPRLR